MVRTWTLLGVLRSKGRKVTGLIALTAFNTLFGLFYHRLIKPGIHPFPMSC
jgi:hypothetical protein